MILYRIIDKNEYEACQNGTYDKLQKQPANIDYKDTNRMYENDSSDNNTQYIYFFPYYEACESWNGEYIMKVDIPDDLLEHGIGSYANPVSSVASFMVLDEYRIKKEEFNPNKYVIEFHKADHEHAKEWGESEEFQLRVREALSKTIPLISGFTDLLDYSGIPSMDVSVPQELQETLDKINKILVENLKKKEHVRTQRVTISNLKDESYERFFANNPNIPSNALKYLLNDYSLEQIIQLFNDVKIPEQISETLGILETGYVSLYESEFNVRYEQEC